MKRWRVQAAGGADALPQAEEGFVQGLFYDGTPQARARGHDYGGRGTGEDSSYLSGRLEGQAVRTRGECGQADGGEPSRGFADGARARSACPSAVYSSTPKMLM